MRTSTSTIATPTPTPTCGTTQTRPPSAVRSSSGSRARRSAPTRPPPRCAPWPAADHMPTFVRTQEIEHLIGEDGRFRLRVTSPDVELRGTDGGVARVRIDFEVRADSDADADAALELVGYVVR